MGEGDSEGEQQLMALEGKIGVRRLWGKCAGGAERHPTGNLASQQQKHTTEMMSCEQEMFNCPSCLMCHRRKEPCADPKSARRPRRV